MMLFLTVAYQNHIWSHHFIDFDDWLLTEFLRMLVPLIIFWGILAHGTYFTIEISMYF